MERFALFGHPVAHSRSPEIHQAFADQLGVDIRYDKIDVPGDFSTAALSFFAAGGRGANVTLPHKRAAFDHADVLTGRARRAGAVNTLLAEDDGVLGDNTDGAGLVRDLRHNHRIAIRDRDLLLVGASGAARGLLGPLLAEQPARLDIANRTANKAVELAEEFGGICRGGGLDELEHGYDLVINATSASLEGKLPALPETVLARGGVACDLVYLEQPTIFLQWAGAAGAADCIDGWGMLVEQAAEAFELWFGERPDTAPMLAEEFRRR